MQPITRAALVANTVTAAELNSNLFFIVGIISLMKSFLPCLSKNTLPVRMEEFYANMPG